MSVAPVIHIGGWPGVGKMTIGRILAETLGGRLIHNHLMLDAARAIYARNTPESVAMREEVRHLIFDHARRLPKDVPIVLTDALADEPAALPLFQPTLDLANDRNAPLYLFVLDSSVEENQRRLRDPSRKGGAKLMDANVLASIRQTDTLFVPDEAVVLDVSKMAAQAAANEILTHLGKVDG
ncbi:MULTISPECIES: nucleoside kinase [unclassified Ruegeria]|uniref:AAA family ATPase n=1 Tax=unclassified Ruegeria TaxID=2625375 RepID=UPI001488C62F|nr:MULTISPECIES: nucleoside kinase [unclassified Ruegeria]